MKFLRAGKIWCMWVFWAVYVRSTVYQTSYRCKKQDGKNEDQTKPLFSVPEHNLASCAVTCWTDTYCLYFVYNRHNKLCHGYGEDVRADEGNDKTTGDQQTCKMRYPRKRATYKLTFKTGWEQHAASKADMRIDITGPCGQVGTAVETGKRFRLRRGRQNSFRVGPHPKWKVPGSQRAIKVIVEYEELATDYRGRVTFETNYWLSPNVEDNQTTGIVCFYRSPVVIPGDTECKSSQRCE